MGTTETQVGAGAASGAAAGSVAGPWGAAIGGVAGGALAYMNAASQAKSDAERKRLVEQAMAAFNSIPDPETKALVYPEIQKMGVLTPQEEKAFTVPETTMTGISVDPRLKEAQFAAMAKLAELGEGGLDVKDLADIERAKQNYAREQQGQQEAIQESMARRGIASSGMESLMRQEAAQKAADAMLGYEQQTQGEARRRALEAIMQRGQMAGNVRAQEFGEQADVAKARDAIAQFNAQMQARAQSANIGRGFEAQKANLSESQRIAEENAMRGVREQQSKNMLEQQAFQNQIARTTGASGMTPQLSSIYAGQAARDAAMYSGLAGAAGKGAETYAGYKTRTDENWDPWASKEEEKPAAGPTGFSWDQNVK